MEESVETETTTACEHVEALIKRAATSYSGSDAMQLSQAALNLAKALTELKIAEKS